MSRPTSPRPAALIGAVRAEAVIGCAVLEPTLAFFTDQLGFQLRLITPADGPTTAVVDGFGLRLRLEAGADRPAPGRLRLYCADPPLAPGGQELVAPNGTVIELVAAEPTLELPSPVPTFELSRFDPAVFGAGRAGMHYRDLLPARQGGRFVASHIAIAAGGPVADYVHYHRIRFQMIYCHRGWVKVVYEDQGPPFVMEPGDCVLQPPEIRHRVLESSPGLEVVEVGSPAVHDTLTDPDLELPNATVDRERMFGIAAPYRPQRFVRHQARQGRWSSDPVRGLEYRDTGIGEATGGLAGVRVLRPGPGDRARLEPEADAELCFLFVLDGRARVRRGDGSELALAAGDAAALPADGNDVVDAWSPDCQLLEVTLPGPA